MLLRKFWLLNLCLILINIKYMLCIKKSNLAFVIDDTFSMQYEIDQVAEAVDSIIDIMDKTNTSEIADIVLVTFNDPDFKLRLKSNSRSDIKRVMGSIKADNGSDCPEMALSGTKLGLEQSLAGSYLYVFTDEYPKDKYLENVTIKICQEKQIQVVFVISPTSERHCKLQKKRNFTPYYNIAKACSGQVFRLSYKQEVPKVLPYVKEIAKGPRTVTLEKTIPANTPSTVEFTIDDETEYAILSTSGQNVLLRLKSGPTTTYEEIVWIDNLKIMKLNKAGYYVAEVTGESTTSIAIFGRSDFTFQHGFSDNVPGIFDGSMKQSYEETETNMLILVDDPNRAVQIQSVQILDMVENILLEIPLHQISGNYYATNKFVPPSTAYKIKVIGKAIATGKILPRTSKTPIQPNTKPRTPEITIGDGSKTISVPYNSTLYLVCYVIAYPKPLITWTDKNLQEVSNQKTESENLTRHINNITVPNMKKSQKYYCSAENKIGSLTKHVQVKVQEPFVVHEQSDANVDAAYGKQVTLLCNVTSHLPMQIQWFFGESGKAETIIHNSEKYFMSSRNTSLQINKMDSTLEGTYKCLAYLVWDESKKKMHSIRVTINDLEAPEFDKQHDIITVREHTEVNLKCNTVKGKPAPKMTWMFKDHIIASDTDLHIANVTIAESGVYTCIAENAKGRAEHIVNLNVGVAPKIDKHNVIIRVEENQSVSLPCNVVGGIPMPNITWLYKNHTIGTTTPLNFTVVTLADAGEYKCIIENSVGHDELNIKLDVQVAPKIDKGNAFKTVKENASVTLLCYVMKGNPTATITWEFKNHVIGSNALLNLGDVSMDDNGEYKCTAKNHLGSDVHFIKLDIEGAPKNILHDGKTNHIAVVEDTVLIPCEVIGNPKPTITWLKNGKIINKEDTNYLIVNGTLIIKRIAIESNNSYTSFVCKAKNELGEDEKEHVVEIATTVSYNDIKAINYVLKNSNTRLNCSAASSETDYVRWYKNGYFIETGLHKYITDATTIDDGNYTCRVSNSQGSKNGETLEVIVDAPPTLKPEPYIQKIINWKGGNDSISCRVHTYRQTVMVTWFHNGKVMPKEHSKQLHFTTWGNYTCKVSNYFGEVEDHFLITSTDCLIDMTSSYITNFPLILTKTSKLPRFITKEQYMIIPSGMPLKLSCKKFQKFSSKEIDVICVKEDQFVRIEDNAHFKFSDLYCSKKMMPKLQITGRHCSGQNTEIVKIGFQVQTFTKVFETCYDTVAKSPLYTKIFIPNPKFQIYNDDDFHEKKYLHTRSFSSGNIKTGYKTGHTKCSYVQGQLVNAEDITYGIAQTAALLVHHLNNIKYFSCVNQANWKHLSDSIRKYLIGSRDDSGLMIWSGTSHWQKESGTLVPRYLWKVVKTLGSEEMIAIVYINAPFPTASDVLCGNKCQDLFIEIPDWQTYCCEVSDFAEAFNIAESVFL